MRKLILSVAVSLDGYIEGPNGEYDWCFSDQDYGLTKFLAGTDAIFYGRKSFEMMQTVEMPPGTSSWADKKIYVFSKSMNPGKGYELISGDVVKKVNEIKNAPGKNIWLFGGAELTTSLMNDKLVDELMIAIHPIILGKGKPLFLNINGRIKTDLFESKTYDTGLVMLYYRVVK